MKKLLRRKLVAQERSTIKNSRVKRNIVPAPFLSLPFLPVSVQPLIVRGVGKAARLGRLYSLVRHPGQSVPLRAGGKGEFRGRTGEDGESKGEGAKGTVRIKECGKGKSE